ncbi:hypothetical protein JW756_00060 [Candidatus Woesearchaeota archaeon]|nr:hypothetical protein [Candidatus Woesearchaeota archaeon]
MAIQMNIPPPYIFQIDTPLIIFNGRLIQPNKMTEASNNFLELTGNKYSLEEICSPKELERMYFRHYSGEFEDYEARYVQEKLATEFKSRDLLKKEVEQNKVLSLIVNNVLPEITAQRLEEGIDEILQEHNEEQRRNHSQRSDRRRYHDEETQDQPATNSRTMQRITRELLDHVRRTKEQMLKQLDEEYKAYERIKSRARPSPRAQQRNAVEERIVDLLMGRNRAPVETNRQRSFEKLDDNSILNNSLLSENIMLIGEKVYDIISVHEFISYFREYMSPELYNNLQRFRPDTPPDQINRYIRENILQIEKKCRSRIRNKLREAKLMINGSYYLPYYRRDSPEFREEIVSKYKKLIEKKIKSDAVEHYEFQNQELQRIAEEKSELEKIAKLRDYERKGAGFTVKEGSYYVYVTTPPYALKSPHTRGTEKYVAFAPAKIGVRIRQTYGSFEISNPMIMHKYKHPFLGYTEGYKEICVGGGGSQVIERVRSLPPDQVILRLLDQGKKTLMMGYRTGTNPYHQLIMENGYEFISKQEVQRRRLVCLNDFE